jgi:hypothetical protein
VRIDITEDQAKVETGKLRLYGKASGYNRTIVIANDYHANPAPGNTVDVYFDSVPTNDLYSLSYIGSDGTETVLVDGAAFHTLQDNSLPPDSPAPTPG